MRIKLIFIIVMMTNCVMIVIFGFHPFDIPGEIHDLNIFIGPQKTRKPGIIQARPICEVNLSKRKRLDNRRLRFIIVRVRTRRQKRHHI